MTITELLDFVNWREMEVRPTGQIRHRGTGLCPIVAATGYTPDFEEGEFREILAFVAAAKLNNTVRRDATAMGLTHDEITEITDAADYKEGSLRTRMIQLMTL